LVWLRMVHFGAVWFSVSYMNLERPHIFKCQI